MFCLTLFFNWYSLLRLGNLWIQSCRMDVPLTNDFIEVHSSNHSNLAVIGWARLIWSLLIKPFQRIECLGVSDFFFFSFKLLNYVWIYEYNIIHHSYIYMKLISIHYEYKIFYINSQSYFSIFIWLLKQLLCVNIN